MCNLLTTLTALMALPAPVKGIRWETERRYLTHVTEAKRRGYTPQSCAQALGHTTQVASSSKSSGEELAHWGEQGLCKGALQAPDLPGTEWETTFTQYFEHVTEASPDYHVSGFRQTRNQPPHTHSHRNDFSYGCADTLNAELV